MTRSDLVEATGRALRPADAPRRRVRRQDHPRRDGDALWRAATASRSAASAASRSTAGRRAWGATRAPASRCVIPEKRVPHFKPGKALREAVDARVGAQRGEPARPSSRHRAPPPATSRPAPPGAPMRHLVWLLQAAIFFTLFAFALNNQHDADRALVLRPRVARAAGAGRAGRLRASAAPSACFAHGAALVAPPPHRPHAGCDAPATSRCRRAGRRRRRTRSSCIRRAMDFDLQWLLLGLPLAFALGWLASRFDLRQCASRTSRRPRPTSRA